MHMIKQMKSAMKSKLVQNGGWFFALQIFNTVIPLITLPYITRILSKTAYGEFSLALNWVGYFQVIVEYGFGFTGARMTATRKSDDELKTIRSIIVSARIVLLIVSLALFFLVISFSRANSQFAMCMLMLFLMVVATAFQQNWFFQGMEELKSLAIINITSRITSVVLIFVFVRKTEDLLLYCFLHVSTTVISSIIGNIIVSRKYNVGWERTNIRAILIELKKAWPLFISAAMTKIFANIGVTILGIVSTSEIVGVYSAINRIPYVLICLFSPISQVLYPRLCKSFLEGFGCGVKKTKKYATPVLAFFIACGGLIAVFHKPIVRVAFGAVYEDYAMLVIPFIVWVFISIVNNFLGIQILVASGHQKEYGKAFSISVMIMLPIMAVFGYMYDAYGIATASMCSEGILTFLLLKDIIRIYFEKHASEGNNKINNRKESCRK